MESQHDVAFLFECEGQAVVVVVVLRVVHQVVGEAVACAAVVIVIGQC